MSKRILPKVNVNGLDLLASHWFQLIPGEEAQVTLAPSSVRVVFKVEDFAGSGNVETRIKQSEDKQTLYITFLRINHAGVGGYGSKRPMQVATIEDTEVWVNYVAKAFLGTVHVSIAFYAKPIEGNDD